jgi:hypothetical protein
MRLLEGRGQIDTKVDAASWLPSPRILFEHQLRSVQILAPDGMAISVAVAAIAPICVDQFQHSAYAANKLPRWKRPAHGKGGICRKRRLGHDAGEQGGRFRRIASLRRESQQLEVGYEGCVQHNGRRSGETVRPSASPSASASLEWDQTTSKSRWGSCSSTGGLNFSWRLILAPPFVLDYLAALGLAPAGDSVAGRYFVLTTLTPLA